MHACALPAPTGTSAPMRGRRLVPARAHAQPHTARGAAWQSQSIAAAPWGKPFPLLVKEFLAMTQNSY